MAQRPYFELNQDEFHEMMSNDAETHDRIVRLEAEVERLRAGRDADRLAVAERAAKAMRWECVKVAENYLTGIKARHIAGAIDLLDAPAIARRTVDAGDAEDTHDRSRDAMNEMAADRSWDGRPADH